MIFFIEILMDFYWILFFWGIFVGGGARPSQKIREI